jgi:replicative DNA helicase
VTGPLLSEVAERAVIGAALLTPSACDHVLDRIRPHDLTGVDRPALLTALTKLRAAGHAPDPRAVAEQAHRDGQTREHAQAAVEQALRDAPSIAGIDAAIAEVLTYAQARRRHQAALELAQAAQRLDDHAWAHGEQLLAAADRGPETRDWTTPQQLADRLQHRLQAKDARRIPTGLQLLDDHTGGLRPSQVTIVLGVTSHGKSVIVDQIAEQAAAAGMTVGVALNEMTADERFERAVARTGGVPLRVIDEAQTGRGRLTTIQQNRAAEAINRLEQLGVRFLDASGLTAPELTRAARRARLDLLVVDGLQGFPPEPGRKPHEYLQDAVHHLDEHAKRTGCHVLLPAHVNRQRLRADGTWPVPGLGDVADCTGATKRADNVVCVWRQQDPDSLDPQPEGLLRLAKWRGAALRSFEMHFDGSRMRWEHEQHRDRSVAA